MKKLLVVDGNSILNRAFYGVRPLSTKDGIPTNAIFGFVNILNRNIEAVAPDYFAVAFDLHAPTFRHKMYEEYKAGRRAMPEELALQFPYAKEAVCALGGKVLELEGFEADDILGTLAAMGTNDGDVMSYILTGDRDSLQLINDSTTVLLATNAEPIAFDRTMFRDKYGVEPEQFVDVKALMGDSSDNIPGVAGIGEKTALKLISEFSSLDGLYGALPASSLSANINAKLESGRDSAYMSQKLARIDTAVPLGLELSDIVNNGINEKTAYELFTKLELSSFIKKFGLDAPRGNESEPLPYGGKLSECHTEWVAVSYDGTTFFACDGKYIYSASDKNEINDFLKSHKIICHDCKSLYKRLAESGVEYRNAEFDIMLAAYIVDSGEGSYEPERLCMKYGALVYNGTLTDAQYVMSIYPAVLEALENRNGTELMKNIEMPAAAALTNMELAGFKINREGIREFGERLAERENNLAARIYTYAGEPFNINSPKQLGVVLFEKLGLPSGKKTKTGYSTGADILEKLAPYHPIIEDILDYREAAKLRATYADGLLRQADAEGRIHTNFKQTGTATGRLSSTEPNLQNIPIKTELGREFRRYFIPENDKYVLIDADYSQIELRILAHISGDENMISAFLSGRDIHTSTAATIFGVRPDDVTPIMRKRAKAVNFGILYGMGDFRLSHDIGITMKEAKQYIENYLASYPSIAEYLTRVKTEARRDGYVTTIMGRRRYIPELSGKNKMLQAFGERVAMNSPIQGSAADIIKLAMINVEKKLHGLDARMILQVHDELVVEASLDCADEAENILREEMENAVKLDVPLNVEVVRGNNWYK